MTVLQCDRHDAIQQWRPPLWPSIVGPHQQVTMDVRIGVGITRFGLHWNLASTKAFLAGRGIELSPAELSLLGDEFLVRWSIFVEESRATWGQALPEDYVLLVDATDVNGGPATVRAIHAETGMTIHAACIPSENEEDLVVFLEEVKRCAGNPRRILRDGGTPITNALHRVFPGVPQQLCHFHFTRNAAKALLGDHYEALKKAVVATRQLPRLQEIAHDLAATNETGERRALAVFARLVIEHVLSARDSVAGFPFRLAHSEVTQRARDGRLWVAKAVAAAMRMDVHEPLLAKARTRLDSLWTDARVQEKFLRVERLANWLQRVRLLMRLPRDFNNGDEPPTFTEEDRNGVYKCLNEVREDAAKTGPAEDKAWQALIKRFREHEHDLWIFPDEPGAARTTNQIESCHRDDRRGVRKRTGQRATAPAMERVGEHLATWSNATNPWFIQHGVQAVDLAQEFLALLDAAAPATRLQAWASRVEGVAATGL